MNLNLKDNKALFSVLLAAILGGGMPVFVKIAVSTIPPFTLTFLRFFIASLTIIPLLAKTKSKIRRGFFSKVVPLSLLSTANVTLFAFGIKMTSATVSQLIYVVVPVVVTILSYFLLNERTNVKKIRGIFFGLLGVVIIILFPTSGGKLSFEGGSLGNIMIFTGMLLFSTYSVLSKRLQEQYSPLLLTSGFAFTTTIAMLPLAYRDFLVNPSWIQGLTSLAIFSVVYIGVIGGSIYYFLYQYAIKHGSPTIASTILYLQPVATYSWALILLAERLTLGVVIGAVLAMSGAWMVTRSKK